MSREYLPSEITAGCPVVLLADELSMLSRQADAFEAMVGVRHDVRDLVGCIVIDGDCRPVTAPGGVFSSRRKSTIIGSRPIVLTSNVVAWSD